MPPRLSKLSTCNSDQRGYRGYPPLLKLCRHTPVHAIQAPGSGASKASEASEASTSYPGKVLLLVLRVGLVAGRFGRGVGAGPESQQPAGAF